MSTLKAKHFHLIEDMDIAALTFAAVERIEGFAAKVAEIVRVWARRSHDRRMLAIMNAHLLDDIGLAPMDVERETAKFFWQN
ncbi:MAG: DUF1127 domain-containing protein [Gammaproteobacteria bacterium]|nr:DUF1127 domain-containing protein [Gammaproteobacteria bacterium]MDH3535318.1 DUF1127 domain-containing protein [Gammaproteobacteria bacterium]